MKVKFSKNVEYIPEWNGNRDLPVGDQIKTVISPMEIGELITLMDALGMSGEDGERIAINMKNYDAAVKELRSVIPSYIKLSNFFTEDGEEIGIELITTYGRFMGLSIELLMQCVQISIPSDVTEKNSEKPPV